MRRRKVVIALLAGVALLGLAWLCLPQILLAQIALGLDGNGVGVENRLVACGPRSISAIISYIGKHSTQHRGGAVHLPAALRRLGDPAHASLLRAIDAETDDKARGYLIVALQDGFDDFTRLPLWVDMALQSNGSRYGTMWLNEELSRIFKDAPPLVAGDKQELNPAFVSWWDAEGKNDPRVRPRRALRPPQRFA